MNRGSWSAIVKLTQRRGNPGGAPDRPISLAAAIVPAAKARVAASDTTIRGLTTHRAAPNHDRAVNPRG